MNRSVKELLSTSRKQGWHPIEFALWCTPAVAYFIFPDDLLLLSQIAIIAIFCLSLDMILGYAGILSLGQAAFFGLGAYTAGLMSIHISNHPLLGLLVAGLLAGLVGLFSAPLLLGGRDLTRLLITLGVAAILSEAANKLTFITGGVDGLQGITVAPLLGVFEFDLIGRTAYGYSMTVLFGLFWLARRITESPFGLSLKGIRMNSERMPAIGTPVNRRLTTIYAIGATFAGIAGALLAQTNQFVALDVLSFSRSAELMLILVLGGAGRLYGAILGAVTFTIAHHFLSELNPQYWQFWMGILLIAIVLFAKDGILGALERLKGVLLTQMGSK